MGKQVSIAMLKEEVKMYDEFIEIPLTLADGTNYSIKLYPYFKPDKVRDLIDEMTEFIQNCNKEKVEIPKNEEDDLIGYFIVKYFTDLKFTKSKKAKIIYEEFKIALNTEIFKILIEAFPPESIQKVYERMHEVIEANAKLHDIASKAQKQIQELPLENRQLFEEYVQKHNVKNILANPVN